MKNLTSQKSIHSKTEGLQSRTEGMQAFDSHSMPWLTGSEYKRITGDQQNSEFAELDEDDESTNQQHRITRVRHRRIFNRVRQKLQED